MKTRGTLVFCFVVFFVVLNLTGCANLSKNEKSTGNPDILEPQAMLKFSDIPVPSGFKQLPNESYSFESGGMRVALLRYRGKGTQDQVVNFYKEQMVMYNWNLLNIVEYGQRLLNFERDAESCIINLTGSGNTTNISITLGPKTQPAPKKTKTPLK
ncbi:MAG: hypothetical protein NT033_00490 [Candidatus Omnitrophica bacterium]|nr:hypothetical protein [Candidatus Omnitrophota bacterium]